MLLVLAGIMMEEFHRHNALPPELLCCQEESSGDQGEEQEVAGELGGVFKKLEFLKSFSRFSLANS
jgi:hypothetical protein